jgi:hypothetical protein
VLLLRELPMPRQDSLQRSMYALERHGRFTSISSSVSVPRGIRSDHRLPLDDAFQECIIRCTQKRTMSHSIEEFFYPILFTMKKSTADKIKAGDQLGYNHLSALATYKTVMHSPLEAIAAITQVRVPERFRRKQMRRERPRAVFVKDHMLL